jgi:hypothetical protein
VVALEDFKEPEIDDQADTPVLSDSASISAESSEESDPYPKHPYKQTRDLAFQRLCLEGDDEEVAVDQEAAECEVAVPWFLQMSAVHLARHDQAGLEMPVPLCKSRPFYKAPISKGDDLASILEQKGRLCTVCVREAPSAVRDLLENAILEDCE